MIQSPKVSIFLLCMTAQFDVCSEEIL